LLVLLAYSRTAAVIC